MAATDPAAPGPAAPAPADGVVARVVAWLRAGYPTGVPETDYLPLLGILQRSLTRDELEQVVRQLLSDAVRADAAGEEFSAARMRQRIEETLLGPALPEDLVRVSARLASAAGQTTASSPPRKAFIVAISSQSCRTTRIRTRQRMPWMTVVRCSRVVGGFMWSAPRRRWRR